MKFSDNKIIQSLLPDFFQSGIEEFTVKIEEIILQKDKSELFRLAHSWKGASAQYEFPELAQKCKLLQVFSENEDWTAAQTLGKEILAMIIEIKNSYEEYLRTNKKSTFYKR